MELPNKSSSHAVYNIKLHIVFVTKYRRKTLSPVLDISVRINNLKTANARRARNRFAEHLNAFYWKPLFWHRAYFVSSVGGATLETVKAYVERQGTQEHARKKLKES